MNCGVSALVNNQGMYDYNNMQLIKMLLVKGGVLFDIGANIGSFTLIAAEQNQAKVVAFEPHPRTFAILSHNVQLNEYHNVTLVNCAVGSQNSQVFLSDKPSSSINSIQNGPGKYTIEVPGIRIDDYCAENDIQPDLIKIDIEGFEFDALLGFGDFLRKAKLIFIEQNGLANERSRGDVEINDLLLSNGYCGPFKVDFDHRKFHRHIEANGEDSIFINHQYAESLRDKYGYTFED